MNKIIQSLDEQKKAASVGICDESLSCMRYQPKTNDSPWTWVVDMIVDTIREADLWFEEQKGPARVYYGTGFLRSAK